MRWSSLEIYWGMLMECTVRWTGLSGMTFLAETGSGHLVTMDGAPDGGGRNLAPRPMEVVLAGTGGCTAYDVVLILRKSGQEVRGCDVTLKAERAEKDPKLNGNSFFWYIREATLLSIVRYAENILFNSDIHFLHFFHRIITGPCSERHVS